MPHAVLVDVGCGGPWEAYRCDELHGNDRRDGRDVTVIAHLLNATRRKRIDLDREGQPRLD